jgi:succinate-semialdehyde dehydrogenase/glutarate-semialdehyde dehydrogenase
MSDESAVLEKVPKQLLVAGDWVDGSEGTLPVEDPATQETLTEVADASPDDAVKALDAAVDTQKEWQQTPPRERGEILRRAWEEITERADELALLMTLEMGKSLAESKAEITYGSEFLRWFAEQAVRIDGRYAVAPNDEAAGRAVSHDHAVELPACNGDAQDRARRRGRLHDGREAGEADAALDARARRDPR